VLEELNFKSVEIKSEKEVDIPDHIYL